MKSCYQVLGLASPKVSQAEIEAAYQSLLAEHGAIPDYRQAIEAAYATLSDPERRAAHDRRLLAAPADGGLASQAVASGGGGMKWLGVISVVVSFSGYYYSTQRKTEAPPPGQNAPSVVPVSANETAGTPRVTPDERSISIPADANKLIEPGVVLQQSTATSQRLLRPTKKAGFDADYLSWTVYLVLGGRNRGSGVMVSPGKVLTNCHVVAGNALSGLVVVNSATREVAKVDQYAKLEDDEDVCLLNVPTAPSHVAEWGRSESLDIGATTYTVSFPGNEGLTWSSGKLIRREYPLGMEVLMTSNYCRPGVSGGPLFDEKGLLIGITSAGRIYRSGGTECMSLTAETARKVLYKPMVPIALAPTQYDPAMLRR